MSVGRIRTRDRHLPSRVYLRHGAYFFVDKATKWHALGKEYPDALKRYAMLLAGSISTHTVEMLWSKYQVEELHLKSAATQRNRKQEMQSVLKVFRHTHPNDIEPHHVWTYWRRRGQTEQARHEIRTLSALLTFGRQCGAVTHDNPCYGLKLPGAASRDRYVTDEEFLAVREIAPTMIGYAMDIALIAGMDQSTVRKLERRHVTKEGLLFERGKTGVQQLVEWNDELHLIVEGALREAPQLRRFVICTRGGKGYTANGFQTAWQRLQVQASETGGLAERYTFHDLRAKSASDADSDQEAADRLGHGNPALTRKVYRRLPRVSKALRILDK